MASKSPQKSANVTKSAATTRGLGRGLSTLLGDSGIAAAANQVASSDQREYQQIPGNGLMLVHGNRAANLIANSLMNWLTRSAKKALSNLFCYGQHLISQVGFNLLLVNGGGVRRKLRSFMTYRLWSVT